MTVQGAGATATTLDTSGVFLKFAVENLLKDEVQQWNE